MSKKLEWRVGSNGNEFADGPRPNGPATHVRYCIDTPHPRFGNGMYWLTWNGNVIGKYDSSDAAKASAEREAAGTNEPYATAHKLA